MQFRYCIISITDYNNKCKQKEIRKMKQGLYTIDYEVITANGNKDIHRIVCETKKECENICERCEALGIKIVMVNYF